MSTKFSTPKTENKGKNGRLLPRVNWKNGVMAAGTLAGAALLAAACGGAPKPPLCQKMEDGSYTIVGNCTVPPSLEGSVDLSVVKEGKVQGPEPEPRFEERMDASMEVFAKQFIPGGLGWLNEILEDSNRHYLTLEHGVTMEKKTRSMVFRISADNSENKVSVLLLKKGGLTSNHGAKLPDNMGIEGHAEFGGANDDEPATPNNIASKAVEESTRVERTEDYTGRFKKSGPEGPALFANFETSAPSFDGNKVFFVKAQNGNREVSLLLVYDKEFLNVGLVSEIQRSDGKVSFQPTAWAKLRFSEGKPGEPGLRAGFHQIEGSMYLILVPPQPTSQTKMLVITLLENEFGHYQLPFKEDRTTGHMYFLSYETAKELFGGK
jgi:hypothetical protein